MFKNNYRMLLPCFYILIGALAFLAPIANANAEQGLVVDTPAPDFKLPGADGREHSLTEFKGKIVILEWVNYECPFVKKHYHSSYNNMQTLQKTAKEQGIVWLSISSSGYGKQGYMSADDAQRLASERGAAPFTTLLDHDGTVGKKYGARTTPHMFVIDAEGILRYQGAIDDIQSTDADDIPGAKNYVTQALNELIVHKKISEPATESYGCSVKYAL